VCPPGGAVVGIVTFWMKRGAAEKSGESAATSATLAMAKADLIDSRLMAFQTAVAKTYVSIAVLDSWEREIASGLARPRNGSTWPTCARRSS
jgi:hypothetical protein